MKTLALFNAAEPISDDNPAVLTIVAVSEKDVMALAALANGTEATVRACIRVGDEMDFPREYSEDIALAAAAINFSADSLASAVNGDNKGVNMVDNETVMRDLLRRGISL